MEVTVYSTPDCVQCMTTKRHMDRLGIKYTEVSLQDNPEKLQEFVDAGYKTAPIVTTDIKIWSGYRFDKIQSLAQYLHSEKVHKEANDITRHITGGKD